MENTSEEIPVNKKYHKIGEVSRILDIPPSTLRFWEKDFKQIKPMKNKKGDRIYSLKDIEILKEFDYWFTIIDLNRISSYYIIHWLINNLRCWKDVNFRQPCFEYPLRHFQF